MEHDHWRARWKESRTAWHEAAPNALLQDQFHRLELAPGAHVFIPLCGKTRDIAWIRAQGHRVTGAELSDIAIRQLFDELGLAPRITEAGPLTRYEAEGVTIFVGDIFDLDAAQLGPVDAIYDRAALVALPDGMRQRYAAHLADISGTAPQLLVTFHYDQSEMDGPPFALDADKVGTCHADRYDCTALRTRAFPEKLKGMVSATETVWHLTAR